MILGVGVADDTDIGMLRVVRDAHSNGGTSR
jgi:hypothetical protein